MKFVRITSYYKSGKFTTCEHLYAGNSHTKAIVKFRKEYPEHNNCIVVAESYDSNNPKNMEHFKACKLCGCVHYY